jgi:hypothetical protein
MKKLILISVFIVLAIMACGQSVSQTFNKIIWVKQGIKFGDNTIQTTAATGTGLISWDVITGKPVSFPPIIHTHDYSEIINTPETTALKDAILELQGIAIPKFTTGQIDSLFISVVPVEGLMVYDKTLHVMKFYNGTEWKIIITNQ